MDIVSKVRGGGGGHPLHQGEDGHRGGSSSSRKGKQKEQYGYEDGPSTSTFASASSSTLSSASERDRGGGYFYESGSGSSSSGKEAGGGSGSSGSSSSSEASSSRLRVQAHHHQHQLRSPQRHGFIQKRRVEPRQMYTLTLTDSINGSAVTTTASVQIRSRAPLSSSSPSSLQSRDPDPSFGVAPTTSATSTQVRRTPLPQAPPNPYTIITLTNESPTGAFPGDGTGEATSTLSNETPTDPSPDPGGGGGGGEEVIPTTSTTTKKKHKTKKPKPTSTRHRHSEARPTRTAEGNGEEDSSRSRSRTRTRTRSRTRTRTGPSDAGAPGMAMTTNVVHVCISRPSITAGDGNSGVEETTFTHTSVITGFTNTNGIRSNNAIASSSRPTSSTVSRDRNQGDGDSPGDRGGITVLTVTDFNCANLPSTSPTGSDSLTTSTTDGGDDTTTTGGVGILPGGSNPSDSDMTSFFATAGGKGAIAGISLGSAAVVVGVMLFFFVWRRKRHAGSEGGEAGGGPGGRDRGSGSSFGDSTNSFDAMGFPFSPPMDSSPSMLTAGGGASASHGHDMAQIDKGPPGSFFVKRNSILLPSNSGGGGGGVGRQQGPALRAAASGSAVSPLSMLEQQPQAYVAGAARPGVPPLSQQQERAMYMQALPSQENSSGEDMPASSSGHGHDPFRDPSSPGHSGYSHGYANGQGPTPFGGMHERRKSGYTSDTYRKRRSRPLSVRNPDSDETRPEEAEALQPSTPPQLSGSNVAYSCDEAAVPSSSGLEYYLGSQVSTPRVKLDSGIDIGVIPATVPPSPERSAEALNQFSASATMSSTNVQPGSLQSQPQPRWTPWQEPVSFEQNRKSLYYGTADAVAGPSGTLPEAPQPQMAGYNPYAGIVAAALHPQGTSQARQSQGQTPSYSQVQVQSQPIMPPQQPPTAAGVPDPRTRLRAPSHGSQEDLRPHRPSIASSDGASSRSSLWRAWEQHNRSWVNDGNETPHDIQDVQLGGGNNTSVLGYFSFR